MTETKPQPTPEQDEDEVVLLKQFADAMATMPDAVPVYFPPEVLMSVISHVQLALRHPGIDDCDAAAAKAQAFVDTAKLAFPPVIQRIIEMGNNPEYDVDLSHAGEHEIEVEIPVDWTTGEG